MDTVDALTGPIVRGDCNTINVHLRSLRDRLPSQLELYKTMAEKTIEMISGKRLAAQQKKSCIKRSEDKRMPGKFTVASFAQAKQNREKITMLTAYDYSTAKILDESGIDSILVGDSLGMTMQGKDSPWA